MTGFDELMPKTLATAPVDDTLRVMPKQKRPRKKRGGEGSTRLVADADLEPAAFPQRR